jgi:hypothetical protein
MNILDAIRDPKVFAPHFRSETWNAWFAFLAALFALPMTDEQLEVYQQHTGRSSPPTAPSHEAWLVIGRRGGKSFILATIAVFLAVFKDWRPFLGPGETGTIMIIAADRKQARVIMRYCLGLLQSVPMLKRQIESATQESINLKNSIAIEIHTASFRTTRGYTIVAALLDEIAYWPVDETAAVPDVEVINAIRPGMATIKSAVLLCASSPHARRGALWDAHRKHYGKDGDPILVWQAPTRAMNATVPQSFIDQHVAEDPQRAAAEYGATFRSDLEAFVLREAVEACISADVYERAPLGREVYFAAADPSGGSSDSFTLCIAHADYKKQTIIIDCLREQKPPFSPEAVVSEFSTVLKSYNLSSVVGDRYAGEWPKEQFSKFGINYTPASKSKSDLYVDLLPLINSGRIELLDHQRSINQVLNLERRTARGGRESIDHSPGQHDDLANVIAGAAQLGLGDISYDHRALARGFAAMASGVYPERSKEEIKKEQDDFQRARLHSYLYAHGGFGFP